MDVSFLLVVVFSAIVKIWLWDLNFLSKTKPESSFERIKIDKN